MGNTTNMAAVLGVCLLLLHATSLVPVSAKTHHVVGDDRGWDMSTDIATWVARRIFRVGDSLWFTYSAAAQESIVEVGSREEYESCDVSNPIRMYTDGLSEIELHREGTRFFASGNRDSCRNGLRIPVQVKPVSADQGEMTMVIKPLAQSEQAALAATPVSPPSGSTRTGAALVGLLAGMVLFCAAAIAA